MEVIEMGPSDYLIQIDYDTERQGVVHVQSSNNFQILPG
jgi:hypothetical protein